MLKGSPKRRNKLHQGVIIAVLTILVVLIPVLAYAAPVYKELEKVIVKDAVIVNNTATVDNLSGPAGTVFKINTRLNIPGGQLLQISFKLKNSISNGKLTVVIIGKPSVAPPANAIVFFNVNLEGFSDSDIEGAEILFRLGNKYVNVQLHRLQAGQWFGMSTSRVETGVSASTYKSEIPGLSSEFAITATKGQVKAEVPVLPYTSGNPIYVVGLVGVIFILAGLVIRLKEQVNKGKKVS